MRNPCNKLELLSHCDSRGIPKGEHPLAVVGRGTGGTRSEGSPGTFFVQPFCRATKRLARFRRNKPADSTGDSGCHREELFAQANGKVKEFLFGTSGKPFHSYRNRFCKPSFYVITTSIPPAWRMLKHAKESPFQGFLCYNNLHAFGMENVETFQGIGSHEPSFML